MRSTSVGTRRAGSLRVDQSPSSLPKAEALGPEVFSIASCRESRGVRTPPATPPGPPTVAPATAAPGRAPGAAKPASAAPSTSTPTVRRLLAPRCGHSPAAEIQGGSVICCQSSGPGAWSPGSAPACPDLPVTLAKSLPPLGSSSALTGKGLTRRSGTDSEARSGSASGKGLTARPSAPQTSRKGRRAGGTTHLCSKSRHPCRPGWWTRGLCRT